MTNNDLKKTIQRQLIIEQHEPYGKQWVKLSAPEREIYSSIFIWFVGNTLQENEQDILSDEVVLWVTKRRHIRMPCFMQNI